MVSAVGIGCNAFSRRVDLDGVREILDRRARHRRDAARHRRHLRRPAGRQEELLGEALAGQRDEFVLATKFGMDMQGANGDDHGARGSRRYVRRAVEASLRRLQTDHIDLYQLHAPDDVTPIEETLVGADRPGPRGQDRATSAARTSTAGRWPTPTGPPQSAGWSGSSRVQNRYSLLDRTVEAEVVPACEAFGLGILPFFPLEYGLLTGKYRRGEGAPDGSRAALDPSRAQWLDERRLGPDRGRREVRRGARPRRTRRRDRRARRPARRRVGDLRRDLG